MARVLAWNSIYTSPVVDLPSAEEKASNSRQAFQSKPDTQGYVIKALACSVFRGGSPEIGRVLTVLATPPATTGVAVVVVCAE